MEHAKDFEIVGGEHDGQTVRLSTEWDGHGHRPYPPIISMVPRDWEPGGLLDTFTPVQYKVVAWQRNDHRWYDLRPMDWEPEDPPE